MDLRIAIPEEDVTPAVMNAGLEATTRLDEQQIVRGDVPLFKDSNPGTRVVWQPEPPGAERFDHARKVLGRGWGDCDDLASWHSASLRASGEDPEAKAVVVKSGPNRWHAIVQRSNGKLEDPSRMAGMPHSVVGVVSGGIEVPPEDWCACPAVVPAMHEQGKSAIAMHRTVSGVWLGRADIPIHNTPYALSAMHGSRMPSRSVIGAINAVLGWSSAARVLGKRHLARMTALAGLCDGHDPRDIAQACGAGAVRDAYPLAREIMRANECEGPHAVVGQASSQQSIAAAAQQIAAHPNASDDQRKVAQLVVANANGARPAPGSLADAVMQYFNTTQGQVAPGSHDEHARLLLADQTAKQLGLSMGQAVGFDFGHFISDIAHGVGDAAKTVSKVVAKVAPIVAIAANVIPPPFGQAISLAAAGAGALAGALNKAVDSVSQAAQQELQKLASQYPGAAAVDLSSVFPS